MISVQNLTFGYAKKPLFEGLSLTLPPGSIYGLLGLNGAGKTSLLKLVAGALQPRSGDLLAWGRVPGAKSVDHLTDTVFVPENPWVPELSVSRWVDRVRAFRPQFDEALWSSLVMEFDLDLKSRLPKLSFGQRKKAILAAGLASSARTLLLDEPTNGLDIPSKGQFRRVLARAVESDRVIVVSTHQIRDLESLFDTLLIMDQGRVPFALDVATAAAVLTTQRVASLDGLPVVWAQRDALGWSAVTAQPSDGAGPDWELVFSAAVAQPERLSRALEGHDPGPAPVGGW